MRVKGMGDGEMGRWGGGVMEIGNNRE